MRRVLVWFGILAASHASWAENGYRNVVNTPFATVADGPLGAAVVDVADPAQPTERASRLRGATHRAAGRSVPAWFKLLQQRGLLPANQPAPILPLTVVQRHQGRLLLPELTRSRQAGTLGQEANRLTFDFALPSGETTAVAWSTAQETTLRNNLATIEPILRRLYGPPAFNLTVKVLHDPSLNSLNMVAYDASANQIRIELLRDVDSSNPAATAIDSYDLYTLTFALAKAWRDDALIFYDAWEDGMARAVQLLTVAEALPEFGFLGRDFNLLFTAYDVLNQPGLESPTFRGADGSNDAETMRDALGTIRAYLAQAAWLKIYAESPTVFADFNDAYYAQLLTAPGSNGNVPLLKHLLEQEVPQVEGLALDDWYRRQYVLDTAVIPGAKLYVFNIPQKDFITGEPTNSLPMNIYHFEVSASNQQVPLTGTVDLEYTAYDGFDLTPAVEGASGQAGIEARVGQAGNPAGIGSAVPLFFNIAGDQGQQMQRIEVRATCNGIERQIWFPNDVAVDDTQVKNHIYGLVTNGFQGTVGIAIDGRDPLEANVIQGAFKVKVPGGLPVPARATFTWTPDSSGGSSGDQVQRNVMFLGPIGTGLDVENGDAVIVFETPPEVLRPLSQSIPAGLSMITIPAFAQRINEAQVLGVAADQLLLARADGAITSFQPFRFSSLYRLWPDVPAFRPGYAYWVQTGTPLTVNFQGVEANRDRPFRQHYPPGWAQIGNPYNDLNIRLEHLQVQAVDGTAAMTLAEAQSRGVVSSGVFRFDRVAGGYALLEPDDVLTPFEGFWINILDSRGATIVYPNQLAGSRSAGRGRGRVADPLRWQVGLRASCDGRIDSAARFGVAPGAGAGVTRQDVAKPPAFGSMLLVSFEQAAGAAAGRYAVDLREPAAQQSWEVLVESNLGPREVTLNWPDVARAPAGLALTLTDLETGQSRFLRSTAGYTFRMGAGGSRRLRLTASRDSGGGLAILGLELRAGRGSSRQVGYTLSQPATVTVNLHGSSGRLLRTLAAHRASAAGSDQVTFETLDANGRPLPNGLYRLELIAVGDDGRQVRSTRVVRVER